MHRWRAFSTIRYRLFSFFLISLRLKSLMEAFFLKCEHLSVKTVLSVKFDNK